MTYQVVYSSQASGPLSLQDLEAILDDARTGNEKRNITGALVFVDGVFLQILEGDKKAVQQLMKSIEADQRHFAVTVFHEGEADRPLFPDWRMAYVGAQPAQMAEWSGHVGTASVEAILKGMRHEPARTARVIENILKAVAG